MRRLVILVGVVGCGFEIPAGVDPATPSGDADVVDTLPDDGAVPDDAAVPDSATPDAPLQINSCAVGVASTTGTDRGRVGANGGSSNPTALACMAPTERIVGMALRMSNQNTDNGGRSAHALQIACATVTVTTTNTTVGTVTMREVSGAGGFNWTPSTLTETTMCQPGWVISGIHAHEGSSQNLFVDVTIRCTQITDTGALGASEMIKVAGSLTNTQNASDVDCAAGEVLARLPNRKGAGLDSVNLSCSPPTCL